MRHGSFMKIILIFVIMAQSTLSYSAETLNSRVPKALLSKLGHTYGALNFRKAPSLILSLRDKVNSEFDRANASKAF